MSQNLVSLRAPEPPATPGVTDTTRLSRAMTILLERVRLRFNIAIDVLDETLSPVFPRAGGDFWRALQDEFTRGRAVEVLRTLRSDSLQVGSATFSIQALRSHERGRRPIGLLAIRTETGNIDGASLGLEPWLDVLRAALETDFSASVALVDERSDARRTVATLRFIAQLPRIESEEELILAVIHAAAVWFDADARVYRLGLNGDLTLEGCLPGATITADSVRLSVDIPPGGQIRRLAFTELPAELAWCPGDVMLATLDGAPADQRCLLLTGTLPPEAEDMVAALAGTLASELTVRATRRVDEVLGRLTRLLADADSIEYVAASVLDVLVGATGATAGALSLHDGGANRELAVVGAARPLPDARAAALFAMDQLLLPVASAAHTLMIDLRREQPQFTAEDVHLLRTAGTVLAVFLAGQGELESDAVRPLDAFEARMKEEVERAKRFDLRLGLVLIDLDGHPPSDAAVSRIVDALRDELRRSDVLGFLSDHRLAALLVHTDAEGVTSVMPRLKRRVALLTRGSAPAARVGRSVFSHDCRTAAAMLSQALRTLEPVQ